MFVAEGIPNKAGDEEQPQSCSSLSLLNDVTEKPSGCKYPGAHPAVPIRADVSGSRRRQDSTAH